MRTSKPNVEKSDNKTVYHIFYTLLAVFFIYMAFFGPENKSDNLYLSSSNPVYPGNNFRPDIDFGNNSQDLFETTSVTEKKTFPSTESHESILTGTVQNRVKTSDFTPPVFLQGQYDADIKEGIIGVSEENPLDDPTDNVFLVTLDGQINADSRVTLAYDLYGIENVEGVSKSINENYSTGGYSIKLNQNWTQQSEPISASWLKSGTNVIKFNVTDKAKYSYKIKNLRLLIDEKSKTSDNIVLITKNIKYEKDNKVYIKGYLKNFSSNTSLTLNNEIIPIKPTGEFEYLYNLRDNDLLIRGLFINSSDGNNAFISIDEYLKKSDIQTDIQQINAIASGDAGVSSKEIDVDGAKIFIPEQSLEKETKIMVTKLRNVDIPPLDAGMVNVTKGNKGYRFLPHGSIFKKEVTVELAYDEALLPPGYTEKDIKTYFFNESAKRWEALALDSVNKTEKMIVSKTNHFTDMINGVIQVPESPQTNAFTPTMMNDIKAADPLANVNMVSPPSANQKGTANISYPFKLPAGRMGVQPQLGLQYSNEGGSGYVGYGWNMSMPAITIDSRWGVPKFDPVKETEIYMLNGEQLVYPKTNEGDDEPYMPHRHTINNGIYDTSLQDRTLHNEEGIKIFTPRKKGSFAKIERKGENPKKYCWIVTDENGTKSYYGTLDGEQYNPNYVIQDVSNNIVQWALARVEDKYGNNMTYTYLQVNKMLYPSRINYTGQNDQPGIYNVAFEYESNTRSDVVINARNGLKQTDNKRLKRISINQENTLVKSYRLEYHEGKFGKSLLDKVTENTPGIQEPFQHTFEYYDDVEANGGYFSQEALLEVPCDEEETFICGSLTASVMLAIANQYYGTNYHSYDDLIDAFSNGEFFVPANYYSPEEIVQTICNCSTDSILIYADDDFDGVINCLDNCRFGYNPDQADIDGNGIGDACEGETNPPLCGNLTMADITAIANQYYGTNYNTFDALIAGYNNGDFTVYSDYYQPDEIISRLCKCSGDANLIYNDDDSDGIINCLDICGGNNSIDSDNDNYSDACDNCPNIYNPDQLDEDNDSIGDVCDDCIYSFLSNRQFIVENDPNNLINLDNNGYNLWGIEIPQNVPFTGSELIQIIPNDNNYNPINLENEFEFSYKDYAAGNSKNTYYKIGIFHGDELMYGFMFTGIATLNNGYNVTRKVYNEGNLIDSQTAAFSGNYHGELIDSSIKYSNGNLNLACTSAFDQITVQVPNLVIDNDNLIFKLQPFRGEINLDLITIKSCFNDSISIPNPPLAKFPQRSSVHSKLSKSYFQNSSINTNRFKNLNINVAESDYPCFVPYEFTWPFQNAASIDISSGFLGSNVNRSWSVGGSLGIGIGKDIQTKNKTFSWGINFGGTKSYSDVVQMDINGDGLPDLVKKQTDGNIKYRIHRVTRHLDENGQIEREHTFDPDWKEFRMWNGSTVREFYFSKSESDSWINPHLTIKFSKLGGNVGFSQTKTNTETKIFLTDGNGDQLPDISVDGRVFFNKLVGDIPTFYSESDITENMLITAAPAIEYTPELVDSMKINFPKFDVIKVWEAPRDGLIKINNNWAQNSNHKVSIETQNNEFYGYPNPYVPGQCRIFSSNSTDLNDNEIDHIVDETQLRCQGDGGGQIFRFGIPVSRKPIYRYKAFLPRPIYVDYRSSQGGLRSCHGGFQHGMRVYEGGPNSISIYKIEFNNAEVEFSKSRSLFISQAERVDVVDGGYQYIPTNRCPNQAPGNYGDWFQQPLVSGLQVDDFVERTKTTMQELLASTSLHPFNTIVENNYFMVNSSSTRTDGHFNFLIQFDFPGLEEYSNFNGKAFFGSYRLLKSRLNFQGLPDVPWANQHAINYGHYNDVFSPNYRETDRNGNLTFANFHKIVTQANLPYIDSVVFNGNSYENIYLVNEYYFELFKEQFEAENPGITVSADYVTDSEGNNIPSMLNFNSFGANPIVININGQQYQFTSNGNSESEDIYVKKGQKIYFRLHEDSPDSSKLDWDPEVTYLDEEYDDTKPSYANTQSSYSESFVLNQEMPNILTETSGTVNVGWAGFPLENISDKITLKVTKLIGYNEIGGDGEPEQEITYLPAQVLYEQEFLPGDMVEIPSEENISFEIGYDNISVGENKHTELNFEVISNSNIEWENFNWRPFVDITQNTTNDTGSPFEIYSRTYPVVSHSIYKEVKNKFYFNNSTSTIRNNNEISLSGSSVTQLQPVLNSALLPTYSAAETQNMEPVGKLHYVIKQGHKLIASRSVSFNVNAGTYSTSIGTLNNFEAVDSNLPIRLELNGDGHQIVTEYLKNLENSNTTLVTINGQNYNRTQVNLYNKAANVFGNMYRNWGQVLYNDNTEPCNGTTATTCDEFGYLLDINTFDEPLSQDQFDTLDSLLDGDGFSIDDPNVNIQDQTEAMGSAIMGIIGNLNTIPMIPYRGRKDQNRYIYEGMEFSEVVERYIGFNIENYTNKGSMRAASIAHTFDEVIQDPDSFPYQDGDVETGAYSINKYSFANFKVISGGISFGLGDLFGGSNNSGGDGDSFVENASAGLSGNKSIDSRNYDLSDYIDLNGDRYPDLVTEHEIQYTNQTGGLLDNSYHHSLSKTVETKVDSKGLAASGSYTSPAVKFDISSKGDEKTRKAIAINGESTMGVTGNFGKSDTSIKTMWVDINGDGLSDKLTINGTTTNIYLNEGNERFVHISNDWNNFDLSEDENISYGGGLNFGGGFSALNNAGESLWNGSWDIGRSQGGGKSNLKKGLIDINGDGLLDVVDNTDGNLRVRFNQGSTLSGYNDIDNFNLNRNSKSYSQSINGGLSFSIPIPAFVVILKLPSIKIDGTPVENGTSSVLKSVTDYDGDGYPDFLRQMDNGNITIQYSNIRRTNMLKTVTNPIGGEFTIDYEVKGNTYDQPGGKWVMKSVEMRDGFTPSMVGQTDADQNDPDDADGVDVYRKYFDYQDGRYDRREREFYGFKIVRTIDSDAVDTVEGIEVPLFNTPKGTQVYRQTVQNFENRSYYLNGMLKESIVLKDDPVSYNAQTARIDYIYDDNGFITNIPHDKIASVTRNHYELRKPDYESYYEVSPHLIVQTDDQPEGENSYDIGGNQGLGSAFAVLKKTESMVYNFQNTTALATSQEFKYDEFGRPVEFKNFGPGAEYMSVISYKLLEDLGAAFTINNIITVADNIKVYAGHSTGAQLMRERFISGLSDDNFANITEVSVRLSQSETAVTNMNYYTTGPEAGMIADIMYPRNYEGDRMRIRYEYDQIFGMYPVLVTSSVIDGGGNAQDFMNYTSNNHYDFYNGNYLPVWSQDITGNRMYYDYDNFGRTTKIWSPKELPENYTGDEAPQNTPTISFVYKPLAAIPYAKTSHFDYNNPGDPINTYTFSDRMGRPVQVKKDIELYNENTGTSESAMSVSGWAFYDVYERTRKSYHPTYEAMGNNTEINTENANDPEAAGVYFSFIEEIDELDRPVKTVDPAGNLSFMEYQIEGGLMKVTSIVDQSSDAQIIMHSLTDANGRSVEKIAEGGPEDGNMITAAKYNSIGELENSIKVGPDGDLVTTYTYDMGGRKISVDHPDAGLNTYEYDNAGNLLRMQTPNLANLGQFINYTYQYNRPLEILFPALPDDSDNPNNVYYQYYDGEVNNNLGKLRSQRDGSGSQKFSYDNMGNVTTIRRTVVTPYPTIASSVYVQNFEYDSWNRVKNVTYPDSERVTYEYNSGGSLNKMVSNVNGDLISKIGYDNYEQKVYQRLGNGTENHYAYDPALRRLDKMKAFARDGNAMFDNKYEFDKVGNVKSIRNYATWNPNNDIGGDYDHNYNYDRFNRLISASGKYGGLGNRDIGDTDASYQTDLVYDVLNRITEKRQSHLKNDGHNVVENTYNAMYEYTNNEHPNAIGSISHEPGNIDLYEENVGHEEFTYDLNGNMKTHVMNFSYQDGQLDKELFWDEANRLAVIADNNAHRLHHYIYDGAGERIIKGEAGFEETYENGALIHGTIMLEGNVKIYPSAYVVLSGSAPTSMQLTKHYYNGTERIASILGNGSRFFDNRRDELPGGNGLIPWDGNGKNPNSKSKDEEEELNIEELQKQQIEALKSHFIGTEYENFEIKFLSDYKEYESDQTDRPGMFDQIIPFPGDGIIIDFPPRFRPEIYYYHSDHLGTATYLSDANGNPYQFFLNLPFGETMAEQRTGAYNNPYKFNGKELDAETGLYYYGARYYDPRISTFLSVDPLSQQTGSSYDYCYNNPINLIDPTGMCVEGDKKDEPPYGYTGREWIDDDGTIWERSLQGDYVSFKDHRRFDNLTSEFPESDDTQNDYTVQLSEVNITSNKKSKTEQYSPNAIEKLINSNSVEARVLGAVMFSLTGKSRHLYGPDAVSIAKGDDGSLLISGEISVGAILILRGEYKGKIFSLNDYGAGASATPNINTNITGQFYYFTGEIDKIVPDVFGGDRENWTVGAGEGVGASLNFAIGSNSKGNKTYAVGGSVGVGVGSPVVFSVTNGTTNVGKKE